MSRIAITGASRGLGRALRKELAEAGHEVFGCARRGQGVEHVDVTDPEAVRRWSETVGVCDILVNNAGLINRNAPLWEVSPEEFQAVMTVNLAGIHHCVRAFVPAMVRRGKGVVVNFSSTWGRSVSPEVAPYCASKWGVEGLSRALAAELPAGVVCVALNPGIIHTEMLESCFGPSAAGFQKPDQWARRAAPLILGLSASDNGKALTVS